MSKFQGSDRSLVYRMLDNLSNPIDQINSHHIKGRSQVMGNFSSIRPNRKIPSCKNKGVNYCSCGIDSIKTGWCMGTVGADSSTYKPDYRKHDVLTSLFPIFMSRHDYTL